MPTWLDQFLVLAVLAAALAHLWFGARRHRKAPAGGHTCACGGCAPKLPAHLRGRR